MKNTNQLTPAITNLLQSLTQKVTPEHCYQQLLYTWVNLFPCDACVLLKLDGDILVPQASTGMNEGFMGRHFALADHPRLQRIVHNQRYVRFEADCELPDPYDGLVNTVNGNLNVHDCMGAVLYLDGQVWGVMTLDALNPHCFDTIEYEHLNTVLRLTEVVIKVNSLVKRLEYQVNYQEQVVAGLLSESGSTHLLGDSAVMEALIAEIQLVASSDLNVLVLGETGVGKELVAHTIHQQSNRHEAPFIAVNCAALPDSLLESELFGHLAGAFTGAQKDRLGKFELAHQGTLFLDEVGELPLIAQAKLLRVLQSGELQRVGSDEARYVDVRIITATNRNLKHEIVEGRFRADLYHRLSVYPLHVPPLRERGKDILLLANHFLVSLQRRFGVNSLCLTQPSQQQLLRYQWLGNVRELDHVLSRAALKAIGRSGYQARMITLEIDDLGLTIDTRDHISVTEQVITEESKSKSEPLTLKQATEQFQREYIQQQLTECNGNKAAAARQLGVARSNLHRLVKRLEGEGMQDFK